VDWCSSFSRSAPLFASGSSENSCRFDRVALKLSNQTEIDISYQFVLTGNGYDGPSLHSVGDMSVMKRVGETIVIVGMLVSISGAFWLKNLLVTARCFGLCVLLTVIGCGVAALRRRPDKTSAPPQITREGLERAMS
jgi:hypothetical protein